MKGTTYLMNTNALVEYKKVLVKHLALAKAASDAETIIYYQGEIYDVSEEIRKRVDREKKGGKKK